MEEKTFLEMEIREQFILFNDTDFYITAYKVDAENYIDSEHEFRKKMNDENKYEILGKLIVRDDVTDTERVAFTMLLADMKSRQIHPILGAWIKSLASNKDLRSRMNDWWRGLENGIKTELIKKCGEMRLPLETDEPFSWNGPIRKTLSDMITNHRLFPKGFLEWLHDDDYIEFLNMLHYEMLVLANALVEYRERGRVAGEHSTAINFGFGLNFTQFTSLAARIAEYHASVTRLQSLLYSD